MAKKQQTRFISMGEILAHYQNVRTGLQKSVVVTDHYIISQPTVGDYLEIFLLGDREIRFVLDNYPFPRKSFNTNIGYTCIEDFETDMRRMGIPVPARKTPKPAASLSTLDQIKDEVAKEHGHKSWATYTGDEGLGRYNREKQLLDKCDELTLRYASAVSAHERQRAERAEKEVERLKEMLQTSASFLRLGNGADPGKVTHLLEEIGDTLAQKGEGNGK